MKKIAVFGLSANPPTGLLGHQGIVRRLCQSEMFDELWILPVYTHMYIEKRSLLISFEDRMNMSKICFEPESTEKTVVKVLPIEKDAFESYNPPGTQQFTFLGTIDILDYVRRTSESDLSRLTLVLGGDTFRDLRSGKWKESERILSENDFYVFGRCGVDDSTDSSNQLKSTSSEFIFDLESGVGDISSSDLRKNVYWKGNDCMIDSGIINSSVLLYIRENGLY